MIGFPSLTPKLSPTPPPLSDHNLPLPRRFSCWSFLQVGAHTLHLQKAAEWPTTIPEPSVNGAGATQIRSYIPQHKTLCVTPPPTNVSDVIIHMLSAGVGRFRSGVNPSRDPAQQGVLLLDLASHPVTACRSPPLDCARKGASSFFLPSRIIPCWLFPAFHLSRARCIFT